MKIALVYNDLTYWLAGQTGVVESVHSSAGGIRISGDMSIDVVKKVRAEFATFIDRGQLNSSISFHTTRKFDTLDDAAQFSATYDTVIPRAGYLDLYGASGTVIARLNNAIVKPPTREINGLSVFLSYDVVGGKWLEPDGEGGFATPEITMAGEVVTMGTA